MLLVLLLLVIGGVNGVLLVKILNRLDSLEDNSWYLNLLIKKSIKHMDIDG